MYNSLILSLSMMILTLS
jgi:F-type H+-transporting ATPase subunit O